MDINNLAMNYTRHYYIKTTIHQWLPLLTDMCTSAMLYEMSRISRAVNRIDAGWLRYFYKGFKDYLNETSKNRLSSFMTLLELAFYRDTGRKLTPEELATCISQLQRWYVEKHLHISLHTLTNDLRMRHLNYSDRVATEVRRIVDLARRLVIRDNRELARNALEDRPKCPIAVNVRVLQKEVTDG